MQVKINTLAVSQYEVKIHDDNGGFSRSFQSYDSIIALIENDIIKLDAHFWNYSRTTLKYLCQFLNVENKKVIEMKIKTGEYILTNLN